MYIELDTLVDLLNEDLNTIATTLKGSGDIARAIPFNIAASIKDWEDDKVYSETVVVPGIADILSGNVSPSTVYKQYRQVVNVQIKGFSKEITDTQKVLNQYVEENTGKFTKTDDWTYIKVFDSIPQVTSRTVDDAEERFTIMFQITYNFVFKGFTSDDVTILLNNVEIPITSYAHTLTKEQVGNNAPTSSGKIKSINKNSFIQKTISFVMIEDAELKNVLEDIDSGGNLNREYTIKYTLGDTPYYTNTETMYISGGRITVTEGGFQLMEVTFIKALS